MRHSLASAPLVLVVALGLLNASPSSALTNADLACQSAIGNAARSFIAAKHKVIVECANLTIGGGTCNTARRDKRLAKATDKLARAIIAACRDVDLADLGFPGFCFDPTFGDFLVGDLDQCLEVSHGSVVDFVFVPVEYPGAEGLFGRELRCQRAIGRGGQIFVARKMRARARCLDDQLRQKIPASVDCRAEVPPFGPGTGDRKTDGRILGAANDLGVRLLDACSGIVLENLGFPGLCFDVDGSPFDVYDLRACVYTSHEFIADDLVDTQYPPAPNPSPSGEPTPTPLPTPAGACDFTKVRLQPYGGSLDLGWTGLLHDQPFTAPATLTFDVTGCDNPIRPCGPCTFAGPVANRDAGFGGIDNRRCVGDTSLRCTTDDDCPGVGPCAFFFGGPQPLSGGGIGTCIVNQVAGEVSGALDAETGATDVSLPLIARVSAGVDSTRPCPVCNGDVFSNDGAPQGTCAGGARDGLECDVTGSAPFAAFGETSLDCPPSPGTLLAALNRQWDLTTGVAARTLSASSPDCRGVGATDKKCFCDAGGAGEPTRPNSCIDDTQTPEDESFCSDFFTSGFCQGGPVDTVCVLEPFRACATNDDCVAPGDSCSAQSRKCYPDNGVIGGSVVAFGAQDPPFGDQSFPTLVALFCTDPVASRAVNIVAGLPGLGRVELFNQLSLTTEAPPFCGDGRIDAGETCDPPGSDACGGVTCQPDCSCTLPTCEDDRRSLNLKTAGGSDFDYGWTGIAHNLVASRGASVTTNLDCPDLTSCTIDGSALVGTSFGPPLPLSAGGVSSCVVNELREAITGTYNCENGCGESSVKLVSRFFLVLDQDKPCPPCVGDPTSNDGQKGGTCDGGQTPGAACDVGGTSDLFQNAGGAPPDAGRTSNDCLPSGNSVGELETDLNPLTTGTVSVDANVNCLSGAFPAGSCFCTGQVQPNACIPDGVCPASGVCENNPPDGVCSNQTYRQCDLTAGSRDCEDTFPGAGNCQAQLRPCFGTNITRTGVCGTETGILASFFCIPATRAAAINTVAGLPGPAALTLPVTTDGCRCNPGP